LNYYIYGNLINMCMNSNTPPVEQLINATDVINAISTGVIAAFTVAMFFLTRAINKSNSSHNAAIKELYEGLVQAMISSKLPANPDISYEDFKKVRELWYNDNSRDKDNKQRQ